VSPSVTCHLMSRRPPGSVSETGQASPFLPLVIGAAINSCGNFHSFPYRSWDRTPMLCPIRAQSRPLTRPGRFFRVLLGVQLCRGVCFWFLNDPARRDPRFCPFRSFRRCRCSLGEGPSRQQRLTVVLSRRRCFFAVFQPFFSYRVPFSARWSSCFLFVPLLLFQYGTFRFLPWRWSPSPSRTQGLCLSFPLIERSSCLSDRDICHLAGLGIFRGNLVPPVGITVPFGPPPLRAAPWGSNLGFSYSVMTFVEVP